MVNNETNKGIILTKIVDNSNNVVGPILIKQDPITPGKIIFGEYGIFQPVDNKLIDEVAKLISQTKEFLCVSSFLIQDSKIIDEIKRCWERGVRVYILTAAETQLENANEDDNSSLKERKEIFRTMLNELSSHVLIHTGDNLHAKFIISDPKTHPKAIVFTSNLTVRALTENVELAVELSEKSEVGELFRQFLYGFWKVAVREVNGNSEKLAVFKQHPEFIDIETKPERLKWTLGEQLLIKDALNTMIESASTTISLSAWTIDSEHPVAKQLIKKASEGIKVILFTRPHDANKEFISRLISKGGTVYCHRLLHAKSIIVDGKEGLIMTANISKLGLDEGFETAVMLNKEQINVLNKIHNEWKYRCDYRSEPQVMLKDIEYPWINLNKGFNELPKPEIKNIEQKTIAKNLKDYFNENIDGYVNEKSQNNINIKQLNYKINLIPPTIPSNVKIDRVEEKQGLKVMYAGKENYICVKTKEQLLKAEELSKNIHARIVLCDQ